MFQHSPSVTFVLWIIGMVVLLAGCGGSDTEGPPQLGDWMLQDDELTLTQELQVSETENYFLGSVQDLDVTTDGHMVVADREATHLKILRPNGTLLDTLGRQGQGPGEFQDPTIVDVAREDSVYVFDNQLNRLVVFSPPPALERARSMVVTSDVGHLSGIQVLGDRLVGEFTPGYTRKEGLYRPSPNTWHVLDGTTVSRDSLLRMQRRRVAASFGDESAAIAYLPFGRVTRVVPGPDARLYHGFTDSLQVQATALDGTTQAIASVPAAPVPVTEAERDSALTDLPFELRRLIAPELPETKPAFTDLVVAPTGRLWVRRPTEGRDVDTASWWVLNPDAKTIHEIQLPTEVTLEVVQNGQAYGITKTEMGAPAVVRYRIES
jgi:hypothetical protein